MVRARLGVAVLGASFAGAAALAPAALAGGNIAFSNSPGTAAPPTTLGPYAMTAFGLDPTTDGTLVNSVTGPTGLLGLSPSLSKATVPSDWNNWSNGYTGNVYFTSTGNSVTLGLPAGTAAFYLYVEPDNFGTSDFTVTAQDEAPGDTTSSGPVAVTSPGGARYFGFYATGGHTIWSLTVSGPSGVGLAVGEFGIEHLPADPVVAGGTASAVTTTSAQLSGSVDPEGTSTTSYFEYGVSSHYGQVAPSASSADGNGHEAVTTSTGVEGLQPSTTYHYRLVAVNAAGETTYGADETFTTLTPAPVAAAPSTSPSANVAVQRCSVPRLSHVSVSAAKRMLAKAGCAVGKIKYLKRPKSTRGLSYGVVVQSPGSGASIVLGGRVNVTLGWFKKPATPKHT